MCLFFLLVFCFVFLLCSARNSAVRKGTPTPGTSVTAGILRFRKSQEEPGRGLSLRRERNGNAAPLPPAVAAHQQLARACASEPASNVVIVFVVVVFVVVVRARARASPRVM